MSSYVEVMIVVEGQTEQTFVKEVLAPEMARKGIFLHSALIGKPGHKGGDIRFDRAKNDIGLHLKQRSNTYVSTMFDFFRIEADWPGKKEVIRIISNGTSLSATEKAKLLEEATLNEIKGSFPECNPELRLLPYIEMHEFEALLFSDASILGNGIGVDQSRIEDILEEFEDPEEINDRPDTAPSKRLIRLHKGYRKVAMGKTISEAIGIPAIREKCQHFDTWLTTLEQLVKGK